MSGFGLQLEIFCYRDNKFESQARADDLEIGILHFAVEIDDLDSEKSRLVEFGLKPFREIDKSDIGLRVMFFHDPDGNTIELIEVS